MSEQESTIMGDDEDVEAHGKGKRDKFASDEATEAESERDDDVELHGKNVRTKS